MIEVKVKRCGHRFPELLEVTGHAGFSVKGKDVVCAAVSGIVQTAVLGVAELTSVPVSCRTEDGFLACELEPSKADPLDVERAAAVIETALLGLREISRVYPGTIEIVECDARRRGC